MTIKPLAPPKNPPVPSLNPGSRRRFCGFWSSDVRGMMERPRNTPGRRVASWRQRIVCSQGHKLIAGKNGAYRAPATIGLRGSRKHESTKMETRERGHPTETPLRSRRPIPENTQETAEPAVRSLCSPPCSRVFLQPREMMACSIALTTRRMKSRSSPVSACNSPEDVVIIVW